MLNNSFPLIFSFNCQFSTICPNQLVNTPTVELFSPLFLQDKKHPLIWLWFQIMVPTRPIPMLLTCWEPSSNIQDCNVREHWTEEQLMFSNSSTNNPHTFKFPWRLHFFKARAERTSFRWSIKAFAILDNYNGYMVKGRGWCVCQL